MFWGAKSERCKNGDIYKTFMRHLQSGGEYHDLQYNGEELSVVQLLHTFLQSSGIIEERIFAKKILCFFKEFVLTRQKPAQRDCGSRKHSGTFLLEPSRTFLNIPEHSFLNLLEHSRTLQNIPSRIFQNLLEHSGTFLP